MSKKIKKLILFIVIFLAILYALISKNTISYATDSYITINNESEIKEGTYVIESALAPEYVLDVSGASKSTGANVQLWKNSNVNQQKWAIKSTGDGYYKIISINSGDALDVSGGVGNNATNVQQWWDVYVNAQKWAIKSAGNGTFYIESKLNSVCLNVNYGQARNGANIEVYQNNRWKSQKFILKLASEENKIKGTKTIKDGTYQIKSALNENYVFDIDSYSCNNNANLQLWKNDKTSNQVYNVKYMGNGVYEISNYNSKKLLNLETSQIDTANNVSQYSNNNSDKQKWIIKDAGNGYYYIISTINNLAMNVNYGNAKNGANIEAYNFKQWRSQMFKFVEIDGPRITGEKTIDNGIYQIKSALNERYVFDVAEGSCNNNANVQLWSNANTRNQKFSIEYMGYGYYSIKNCKSGKALNLATKNNINQYQSNNSEQQKWIIKNAGNGYYYLISAIDNLAMNVAYSNAKNGANIEAYKFKSYQSQKVKIERTRDSVEIDSSRYKGFKEKLTALSNAHPNWQFKFLYTGINFRDAISGEASNKRRNLVPTSYGGEWINGTELYDSGWYSASDSAIAYYMDPRNFLNETDIFQFLDVNSYSQGSCTLDGIKSKTSGTYLSGYENDINNACLNKNVNPYYVISRLIQEQGTKGGSTWKMESDGKTYYNPFNIEASGDGIDAIKANALAKAKKDGWDSMQKAIEGGIYFLKANWLENHQNTLYQNRFDIYKDGSALYVHQYMQNLMGAYSEAKILKSMYEKTGKMNSNFTFIIPVYENMGDSASPLPSSRQESTIINVKTTVPKLNMRSGSSTNSSIIRTFDNAGVVLLSIQRGINGNWQKVVTSDGTVGYVYGNYLKQINDVTTCKYTAYVKTHDGDGCYARYAPTKDVDRIQPAYSDYTTVTVIDDSTYKNITGYNWSRCVLPSGAQVFFPSNFLSR